MLARIRKSMQERDQGFTLIELLVVMIIIGILAAVAIPVFLSQRAKANDAAAKADVSTIGKELASFYVDGAGTGSVAINAGRYEFTPTTPAGGPATVDLGRASDGVQVIAGAVANITGPSAWCVQVRHPDGDKKNWIYSATGGMQQGTCTGGAPTP